MLSPNIKMNSKSQSLLFLFFFVHHSWCQQSPTTYSQPSPSKVQLEDIEHDNLKSSAPHTPSQPSQSQTYSSYQQDQVVYGIPSQQPSLTYASAQPSSYSPSQSSVYSSPQSVSYSPSHTTYSSPQSASYSPAQSPAYSTIAHSTQQSNIPQISNIQQLSNVPQLYSSQPPQPVSSNAYAAPQYQQLFVQPYYSPQAATSGQAVQYLDFGGLPFYFLPQAPSTPHAAPHSRPPVSGDYYKTLQYPPSPPMKLSHNKAPPASQPILGNYVMSPNSAAYYQPVAFTQPQSPLPYYPGYNPFYQQVQTPQKSIYSSGIKSTTPSSPLKAGKDDHFSPINNSYKFEYLNGDQNSYNKVRASG